MSTCRNPSSIITALAVTAIAATNLSTVARAATLLEPRSVTVHFEDLDPYNSHAMAILYQRIQSAAEAVCGNLASGRSMALIARHASCMTGALDAAIAAIDRPLLTDYAVAHGVFGADARFKMKLARGN